MVVIIMGVSGSGKTTIGRLLAERLGCRFEDADDYHPPVNVRKKENGQPLTDQDRLPWLEALRGLIQASVDGGDELVLACSALKRSYRQRLMVDYPLVRLVYLKIDSELAEQRLEARAGHYMPAELVPSQSNALEEPLVAI